MATRPARLERVSTVDALVASLRARILDGELEPGARLVERELTEAYDVARHSLRAALRELAAEGLVQIEPNRGARVAVLSDAEVIGLYELRTALEVEAARRALERGDGRLPDSVREAGDRLAKACRRWRPAWVAIADAHADFHSAIVAAGASERIARAHRALGAETQLFLMQLRPHWTLERMATDHLELPDAIERRGTDALRDHIAESKEAVTGGRE